MFEYANARQPKRRSFLKKSFALLTVFVTGSIFLNAENSDARQRSRQNDSPQTPMQGEGSTGGIQSKRNCYQKKVCQQVQCFAPPCDPICRYETVCS